MVILVLGKVSNVILAPICSESFVRLRFRETKHVISVESVE